MKRRILGMMLALVCSIMLVSMLSSCDSSTRSKALVVVNDSANAIDRVSILQYVSESKAFLSPNALAEGETISAGANKIFYIAPYAKDSVRLNIQDDGAGNESEDFTYDYLVRNRNREITATYDGTSITFSGSNSAIIVSDR